MSEESEKNGKGKIKRSRICFYPSPENAYWWNGLGRRYDISHQMRGGYRGPHEETLSDSHLINRTLERYRGILSAHFPRLPESTWLALGNAFISRSDFGWHELNWISSGVAEDLGLDGEKEQTGHPDVARLLALSTVERVFVMEVIERIWGTVDDSHARPVRDLLAELSGYPRACVFEDDPAPAERWQLDRREDEDTIYFRHADYPELEGRAMRRRFGKDSSDWGVGGKLFGYDPRVMRPESEMLKQLVDEVAVPAFREETDR